MDVFLIYENKSCDSEGKRKEKVQTLEYALNSIRL